MKIILNQYRDNVVNNEIKMRLLHKDTNTVKKIKYINHKKYKNYNSNLKYASRYIRFIINFIN